MHHDLPAEPDELDLAEVGLPPAGATLMVAAGNVPVATVVVERTLDDHVIALWDGGRLPCGPATVRWFDPAQPCLESDAVVTATDDAARIHLCLRSPWRDVDARRAQRFEARSPMPAHVLQTVENNLVPNLRLGLVCIDLSSSGMRAAHHGRPPGHHEVLEIEMGTARVASRRVMARVARVDTFAFGRSEIGLTFLFDSDGEREHVLAVRDDLAAAGALRSTVVA
jgi:hypothetical protein